MPDRIHLTVATVIENHGELLLVKEWDDGKLVYNQPAGHVEPGETLQQAALRETLEETGWHVRLEALLGLYTFSNPSSGITYYRVCFIGSPVARDSDVQLDEGIEEPVWLNYQQIDAVIGEMRSAITIKTFEDYRAGIRYPIEIVNEFPGLQRP